MPAWADEGPRAVLSSVLLSRQPGNAPGIILPLHPVNAKDRAVMEKARIGFVGVGSMAQMAHLRNYVNIEGCQVVALAELEAIIG